LTFSPFYVIIKIEKWRKELMEIVLIVLAILVATGSFFYVYKQNKAYRAKWEELDAASEKLIQQSEIVRQKNEELEERLAATKELDVL
jgi:uncharacterized membrane protein affecting hemolysin expression